jgi:drug/metabolite transporter (DMT)-like permease
MAFLGKYVWILFTALAFGTMEIALKVSGDPATAARVPSFLRFLLSDHAFGALQLTFLRFFFGGLFLLPLAVRDLRRRGHRMTAADWAFAGMIGAIGVVVSMTLFQLSVMRSNPTLAAVLISINPAFTMVFAHFVAGERFTRRKGLVLAICLLGLVLVANPWRLASGNTPAGILLGLGASVSFGLYTALSKRRIAVLGGPALNCFSFLLGSALELVVLLALGEPVFEGIGRGSLGILLYVSLVVTGFGYFCFLRAVECAGASSASYAFFIKPVVAALLARLVLGDAITWNIALGIALIVGGFLLFARPAPAGKNP